jgi:hypothetical protein
MRLQSNSVITNSTGPAIFVRYNRSLLKQGYFVHKNDQFHIFRTISVIAPELRLDFKFCSI